MLCEVRHGPALVARIASVPVGPTFVVLEENVTSLVRWVAALFFVVGSSMPALAKGADTILILDASGSMWGQVDGQTKISAARLAVGSILNKWKPDDRLGLMAYGHRAKGDCRDIELVVPVSTFDPARIRSAVDGLNPKGKTPIADSLRAAASELKATENKANVVLVSDGIETCVADPCAVAAELKKAGVGFTAHVIGFDVVDPAAKSQLQCIAKVTGGVYLDASNASALENALGKAVDATQGARVQSEAPSKPVADPFQGKNVRGVARLAAGLDPISDKELGWSLFKPANGEKGEFVKRFDGSPFADVAEPGSYIMEIEYGLTKLPMPVTIESGRPLALDVVLNAAYVTSEGSVVGGGSKVDDVVWDVLDKNGNWLGTEYRPVPRFILNAGDYILRLTRGVSKTDKSFSVAAGDSINVSLALDVGKLSVSGVYAPGGPKVENELTVEVYQPAKNDGERGEWIATEYKPLSQFDLPSGSYDVVVSVGMAKQVARVEMKSGAPTRLDVNLNAGVLGLKTGNGKVIEIYGAERDINNQRKYIQTSYEPDLNLALTAGGYVAVVEYADGKKVEKEFAVAAGKRVEVEVKQ